MFGWLDRLQPLGALIMRLIVGFIMLSYGYQKVIPQGGLHNFAGLVAHMGVPAWLGYTAAFVEFFGGMLLIAGLFTRFVSFLVTIDMVVAVSSLHRHGGLLGVNAIALPLACLSIALMLVFTGPGFLALDDLIGGSRSPAKRRAAAGR